MGTDPHPDAPQPPKDAADLVAHPLTAVRLERDWTLRDVADVVQRRSGLNMAVRREKVWRWERGVTPEPAAQLALAAELGVSAETVERHPWPAWLLGVGPAEPVSGVWSPDAAQLVLQRVVESAAMDRRGFLILTSAAATGMAQAWRAAPPGSIVGVAGGRVSAEAVEHLRVRIEELWRLDDALGGDSCLDAGLSDLRLVHRLIRHGRYSSDVGRKLWSLAAALARFCGFAAFDAGRHASAQRFWHAGLRAAVAADEPDQGVYVLSNLALQTAYAGDGATTIALLDAARTRVDPTARTVLAMLDCWAARGHALEGDAKAAAAALHRADDLFDRRRDGDDPDWVYWMPQPSLTAEAGTALLAVGDLPAAEQSLADGLAALDAESARERNLYLVRLAEVQLRSGRLDQAADTTRQAIDAAASVNSTRVQDQVRQLLGQLPADEPTVNEVHAYSRTALADLANA